VIRLRFLEKITIEGIYLLWGATIVRVCCATGNLLGKILDSSTRAGSKRMREITPISPETRVRAEQLERESPCSVMVVINKLTTI
jgi:hypothetical protein